MSSASATICSKKKRQSSGNCFGAAKAGTHKNYPALGGMKEIDLDQKKAIGEDIGKFIGDLASEGERSAVVLGAARFDVALERLLKKVMRQHPGGSDNLFDADRALGTFSGKIALCYRLGLIDRDMEHALQMIRRIRNDFAHTVTPASLSESHHRARVKELIHEAQKSGDFQSGVFKGLSKVEPAIFRGFCAAVTVALTQLEMAICFNEEFEPDYIATFAPIEPAKPGNADAPCASL